MAALGRLQHSCAAQVTVEQIRTKEAHPNSMCVVTVDHPELPPAYDLVAGWDMVGVKSTAASVAAIDYPAGTEYDGMYGFKNGARFFTPPPPHDNRKMEPGPSYLVSFAEPGTIDP